MLGYRGPRKLTRPRSERDQVMSGRRARAGVPAGTCQWSGQFLCAASTSYTTVCTHSEQSHSCRQGCSHGHTVAAPLPQLQRLQQTPRGRGLSPRCLFLTLCRLDVQLPRLLRTDRFPPQLHQWHLLPVSSPGRGREGERACSEPGCHLEVPPS